MLIYFPCRPNKDPDRAYLRRVKGNKWQVRIPLDPMGAVRISLGLYSSREEARFARAIFFREWKKIGDPYQAREALARIVGRGPFLPYRVRKCRGGQFAGCCRIPGKEAYLGPFETAEIAAEAVRAHLETFVN